MTTEERFERIEHLTAGIAEERPKDREEYKMLWRDTQRQINELSAGMVDLRRHVDDLAVEVRHRIQEVAEESRLRIQELAEESREADKRLENRIESLVSAIGTFIASQGKQ